VVNLVWKENLGMLSEDFVLNLVGTGLEGLLAPKVVIRVVKDCCVFVREAGVRRKDCRLLNRLDFGRQQ
jgi:hypothetical protein